jgi:hypothetical protein
LNYQNLYNLKIYFINKKKTKKRKMLQNFNLLTNCDFITCGKSLVTGISPTFGPGGTVVGINGINLSVENVIVRFQGTQVAVGPFFGGISIVIPQFAPVGSQIITVCIAQNEESCCKKKEKKKCHKLKSEHHEAKQKCKKKSICCNYFGECVNFPFTVTLPTPPIAPSPIITIITPTNAVVGTSITILGNNFSNPAGGPTTVTIGGISATITNYTKTSITVIIPNGVPTGPNTVVVTVPGTTTPATGTITVSPTFTCPPLGAASTFAVLGATTVTNTGLSVINGNVGVSPGTAITGFPPGVITGGFGIHSNDALAINAQANALITFGTLASYAQTGLLPSNLNGLTLTPGIYDFTIPPSLTGTVTLNGPGLYVFRSASTLTTATGSNILLTNGAQSCAVFWRVGSSATLGSGSIFNGTIVANTSITANTGASINGRLLALNGAVTLDSNVIAIPTCTC